MRPSFKQAGLLGAGVMGGQIAAHLANCGIRVILLDMNNLALASLERLRKSFPPPYFSPERESLITPGNIEENLEWLSNCDWILEAVVEDLSIKRSLFKKIENFRKPGAIVSSNTSGIKISQLADGMGEDFQRNFLGTHFFNPPRYMRLLEVVPGIKTDPEILPRFSRFAEEILGKSVVRAKDTPGFIANRIGTFAVCLVFQSMLSGGFTIEEGDELTGQAMGRPKSATFRTLDLVGIDTFARVAKNLRESLPDDPFCDYFKLPSFIEKMLERGWLGEKSGQGFFKKIKRNGSSEILALDPDTMEYRPRTTVKIGSLEMAKGAEQLKDRIKILAAAKDKGGDFFRRVMSGTFAYAAGRIPEIADNVQQVDQAMKRGFNWELGPFELWDLLGVQDFAATIEKEGFPLPAWISDRVASGKKSYEGFEADSKFVNLSLLKEKPGSIVAQNAGASLVDLGEKVLCLEFHSKMNAIGEDTLTMAFRAFSELENGFDALVIGNQGKNFCAGANLMLLLLLAQEEEWKEIERAVKLFQNLNMRIKYSNAPVVVAPHGRALGGGCEIVLHAPRVCALAESYIGLVEIGAGLIPAGGGIKEVVLRSTRKSSQLEEIDPLKSLEEAFQTVALAKVSTSAEDAMNIGYLERNSRVCMNPDHLIRDAKQTALAMLQEGYKSPSPEKAMAYGKALYANLEAGIYLLREANRITDYEVLLAKKLATVFSGGDFTSAQTVSEEYLLDLEREVFLSLIREKKTQERMQHLLKRGKPLRN